MNVTHFVFKARKGLLVLLYVVVIQAAVAMPEAENAMGVNSSGIIKQVIVSGDTIVNLNPLTDTLFISIGTNDIIEIDFSSEDLSIEDRKYRYFLKGEKDKYYNWSTRNSAYFHDLTPGEYTFVVQSTHQEQSVYFVVKSIYGRYLLSSLILIIVIVTGIFTLKFNLLKRAKNHKEETPQDTITPLLKKYLKTYDKESTESLKLAHKATVKYDKATVLFADIQGFTKIVEHMNPETLIDELDKFFIHFDEVAEKYKIEKIKTIGDAYMCAGGLPEKNATNPIEVVLAAIEMQRFMKTSNETDQKRGDDFWELRIGIHTGPVISGVIGRKKLSFDIWGDTVNIASRMESSGVAGKINVSGITFQLINDFFECEYRGKMPIKYKGETDMYFVKGIMPGLSVNNEGEIPNEHFFTKLQWIRYNDLEELVLSQLKNELPTSFKYHNIKHTIDVCTQVEVLGRAEGLNSKELLLVKTAALLHDTGYMISSVKHEIQSVRIAKEILPKYGYTKSEIEAINQLIMVTEKNSQPKLLMEKIIKDADLDYLGRADFIPLSEKLWEEVCAFNGKLSQKDWNRKQYEFISKHVYYTTTAKNLRQVNKEIQLKKIKDFLT